MLPSSSWEFSPRRHGGKLPPLSLSSWPGQALRDSHKSPEVPAVKHSLEAHVALEGHDWAGLAVVAGPTAEACADPCGVGERAARMRVFLPLGLPLEGCADGLEGGLVGRIEDVLELTSSGAIAFSDHLEHLHGGDQDRGGELLERRLVEHTNGFDVEA